MSDKNRSGWSFVELAQPTPRSLQVIRTVLLTSVCVFAAACGTASGTDAGTDAGPQTMYDKYGAAGFTAVNDKIITKALALPTASVGTSFQDLDDAGKTRLKANLGAYLIQAFGGPSNYTGRDMTAAHAGLNITEAQYDYFITNAVVPALQEAGVTQADISGSFAPAVTATTAGSIKCSTVQSGKATGCP